MGIKMPQDNKNPSMKEMLSELLKTYNKEDLLKELQGEKTEGQINPTDSEKVAKSNEEVGDSKESVTEKGNDNLEVKEEAKKDNKVEDVKVKDDEVKKEVTEEQTKQESVAKNVVADANEERFANIEKNNNEILKVIESIKAQLLENTNTLTTTIKGLESGGFIVNDKPQNPNPSGLTPNNSNANVEGVNLEDYDMDRACASINKGRGY